MASNPNAITREVFGKTETVLYLTQADVDIFRAGKEHDPRMTKLRHEEDDRTPPKPNDIATYIAGEQLYVQAGTGGISLFNGIDRNRRLGRSDRWWCIPKDQSLPNRIRIAKDLAPRADGLVHYSIEPIEDMLLDDFLARLSEFSEFMYKVS